MKPQQQETTDYYNLVVMPAGHRKEPQQVPQQGNSSLTPPPSPPEGSAGASGGGLQGNISSSMASTVREPLRPPRACDSTLMENARNYYNLVMAGNVSPPPPGIPKRRPPLFITPGGSTPVGSPALTRKQPLLLNGCDLKKRFSSSASSSAVSSSCSGGGLFENSHHQHVPEKQHLYQNQRPPGSAPVAASAAASTAASATAGAAPTHWVFKEPTTLATEQRNRMLAQTCSPSVKRAFQQVSPEKIARNGPLGFSQPRAMAAPGMSGGLGCDEEDEVDGDEDDDDVVLFYSRHCPGAVEWAKYLHKLYTELSKLKGRLKVKHLPVEDVGERVLPRHIEEDVFQSRLHIVLISPTMLQYVRRHPASTVGRLFHPDRVVAIMLGVKDEVISAEHRSVFMSFSQWIHLEAKDHDLEFVQTVLYFSTQILQRTDRAANLAGNLNRRRSSASRSRSCNNCRLGASRANSCSPVKSVVSSSVSPLTRNRNRSSGCRRRTHHRPTESNFFQIHPNIVTEVQNQVLIVFEAPQRQCSRFRVTLERKSDENLAPSSTVEVDLEDLGLRNPYNLPLAIPRSCFGTESSLAAVRVEVDGVDRGSRLIRLEALSGELEQLLKRVLDPVEFMCQATRVGPDRRDKLDQKLTSQFLTNVPRNGLSLLKGTVFEFEDVTCADVVKDTTSGEFPTLLHFAACHGLDRLVSVLLECPGASMAARIRNCSDMTPQELAQVNGFCSLSKALANFVQPVDCRSKPLSTSESFVHVYDYIRQRSLQQQTQQLKQQQQQQQQQLSSRLPASANRAVRRWAEYQIPPPPRPLFPKAPPSGLTNPSTSAPPLPPLPKASKGTSSSSFTQQDLPIQSFETPRENRGEATLRKRSGIEESPQYQEIEKAKARTISSAHLDPYGTVRALLGANRCHRRRSLREALDEGGALSDTAGALDDEDDDDVFVRPGQDVATAPRTKGASSRKRTTRASREDPFGTFRATKAMARRRTSCIGNGGSSCAEDVDGGRRNLTQELTREKHLVDYRGQLATVAPHPAAPDGAGLHGVNNSNNNEDLMITNELIQLLEDFKTKPYSMKEMEALFEGWRRRAAALDDYGFPPEGQQQGGPANAGLPTAFNSVDRESMIASTTSTSEVEKIKNKLKRLKACNAVVKFFKSGNGKAFCGPDCDVLNIRHTKDTRSYRKPTDGSQSAAKGHHDDELLSMPSSTTVPTDHKPKSGGGAPPMPAAGNETIVEAEIGIFDDGDVSIVDLQEHHPQVRTISNNKSTVSLGTTPLYGGTQLDCGISSQILPLSRLSLSSHSSSTCCSRDHPHTPQVQARHQPSPAPSVGSQPGGRRPKGTGPSRSACSSTSSGTLAPNNTAIKADDVVPEDPQQVPDSSARQTTPLAKKASPDLMDRLGRLKKSLTEPLLHYFHGSPEWCKEEEEPDQLNTPKSVAPPPPSAASTPDASSMSSADGDRTWSSQDSLVGPTTTTTRRQQPNPAGKRLFGAEEDELLEEQLRPVGRGGHETGRRSTSGRLCSLQPVEEAGSGNASGDEEDLPTPPPTPPSVEAEEHPLHPQQQQVPPPIVTDM